MMFQENPDLEDRLAAIDYAINNKYLLIFWYRGLGVLSKKNRKDGKKYLQNWRIVEPVSYGLSKKGRYILRAWQVKGLTNTTKPEWKTFLISEISMLKVLDGNKYWAKNNTYSAFDKPSGYNFKPSTDLSMKDGRPLKIIDLNKDKGPDRSIEYASI